MLSSTTLSQTQISFFTISFPNQDPQLCMIFWENSRQKICFITRKWTLPTWILTMTIHWLIIFKKIWRNRFFTCNIIFLQILLSKCLKKYSLMFSKIWGNLSHISISNLESQKFRQKSWITSKTFRILTTKEKEVLL